MRDKFDKIKNTLNKTVNIKRTYLLIIVVVSLGLLAVYFSYALFIVTAEKQGVLNITAGNLYPKISSTDLDENNRITLKSGDVKQIEVVIENINSIDATYKLYYKEIQPAVSGVGVVGLADSTRDTAVNTTSFSIGSYSSTSNKKVATVVLKNTGSSDYIVELGVKVGLSGRPITLGTGEKTLSNVSGLPNPPELVGNMIPVYSSITTSGSNIGTHWYKAENSPNTYYTNSFYDYENQKWANAVTVQIDSNTTYQNASVGKEILMSDIKTMWVWIPRFEYKLDGTYGKHLDGTAGTQANPGAFDIHFIGKDVTTAKSGYKIHPAFEFNGKQLAGIWVSKFNIGGKTMTSPVEYSIKPNIKADNTANFNSAFSTITSQFVGSDWGLPGDGNYDLHMMKNIDWGAIFYLTQSKFGKYGNPSFASGDEKAVYVNNSSSYYTGRSSGMKIVPGPISSGAYSYDGIACSSEACTGMISNQNEGTGASTTGNLSGVYDMSMYSAGIQVAANYNNTIGSSGVSSSWFTQNAKYYDKYTTTSITSACGNAICYGHALSETNNWYSLGPSNFVYNTAPWLVRGLKGINVYLGHTGGNADLYKATVTP